jgi:hypothetical protein
MTISQIYQQVQLLTPEDREVLIQLLVNPRPSVPMPKRSLLELEGLGADIWSGIDAQAYVDALRDEWDDRP